MDPIADMLTKIKNAQAVGKKTVSFPFSSVKYNIARILEREEFIEYAKKRGKKTKRILVRLKYQEAGKPRIHDIKRISKPGRRIYLKSKDIYSPKSGYGLLIISTPKGVLTSKEARKMKTGGEVLCEIW
jgi:small subunit ribosomal protein S8